MPFFQCPWDQKNGKGFGFSNGKQKLLTGHMGREASPACSVHFSHSVVFDSLQPHELQHARPPCPSPSRSSPKSMSIESVMPSSHLILCRPLLLLPPIPPSIRVFPNESNLCMRWPEYWSFSFIFIFLILFYF